MTHAGGASQVESSAGLEHTLIMTGEPRLASRALWQREFIDFDPVPYLERLQMPVLAITGAKDVQVDPEDLDIIAATMPGPVTTRKIEDLSHLLRRDPKAPTLSDYKRQIREPVDAELLALVGSWVAEQANAGAAGSSGSKQQLAR